MTLTFANTDTRSEVIEDNTTKYSFPDVNGSMLLKALSQPGLRLVDAWNILVQARVQAEANVHVHSFGVPSQDLTRAFLVPCSS